MNLPIIKITSINKEERERCKIFNSGLNHGYEKGMNEGLDLKMTKTKEVSQKEYNELIEYLVKHGLEITYTLRYEADNQQCGLIVRKNKREVK